MKKTTITPEEDSSVIWVAYVDMLSCLLVGVLFLFVLCLALVSPKEETKSGAELKAEYIISISWNENADVDLWLADPQDRRINFGNKELGLMHLDFDNRGLFNNKVTDSTGKLVTSRAYEEVATLRGIVPGEYTLNIHLYGVVVDNQGNRITGPNVPVVVKIQKINPKVKTVMEKTVVLTKSWQELTVTRFILDANGELLSFDDTPRTLIR